jgi:hypothetical protein
MLVSRWVVSLRPRLLNRSRVTALSLTVVLVAFVPVLVNPVTKWAVVGSLFLCYSASLPGEDREFLLDTAAWLAAFLCITPLVLLGAVRLNPTTISPTRR